MTSGVARLASLALLLAFATVAVAQDAQEVERGKLQVEINNSAARLSRERTAENLSKPKDESKDYAVPLIALGGTVAVAVASVVASLISSNRAVIAVDKRSEVDKQLEITRGTNLRGIEKDKLDAQKTADENKASIADADEQRRLKIAIIDARIDILAKIIGELRSFALKVRDLNSQSVAHAENLEAYDEGLRDDTEEFTYEDAYNDKTPVRLYPTRAEAESIHSRDYTSKRSELDRTGSLLVIDAERFGLTPKDRNGKDYSLGEILSRRIPNLVKWTHSTFDRSAQIDGEAKTLIDNLALLAKYERSYKDAVIEKKDRPVFDEDFSSI